MTDSAVIQATYADLKRIKTRKVYQLVFEVPAESIDAVTSRIGFPDDSWFAIAKLATNNESI